MSAARAVAITGAAGLVGSHLAAWLAARGCEVRALVRDPAARPCPAAGVASFRCDLPDELDPAGLAGADALVHCAWSTRARNRAEAVRTNEAGTRRLFDDARRAGVGRIVFVSSLAARNDSPAYYARSKLALERELDPSRDLCLRPGLVLAARGGGLFARLRESVERSRLLPVFAGGRQVLQTVHVDDLCAAVHAALERELRGTLAIAERDGISYRDLLMGIARRLGRRCVLLPIPQAPALLALRLAEVLRVPMPVTSENLLGLCSLRPVDTGADLLRLGLEVRAHERSLDEICAAVRAREPTH